MRIVVASGKGGTGKTLVATNLAWMLAERIPGVTYADADVECPNGHLFLQPDFTSIERHAEPVPVREAADCSGCGSCQRSCAFGAIVWTGREVRVFPELCHGCGACLRACEERALGERPHEMGTLRRGHSGRLRFVDGTLDVGEVRASPLVRAVVGQRAPRGGLTIVDAPPGTSCAAIAAVDGADLALLVTEPTPFGLHDLKLSLDMCDALGLPTAAIINRADLGNADVRQHLSERAVSLMAELPFDREVAAACAAGVLTATRVPAFASIICDLAESVVELAEGREH